MNDHQAALQLRTQLEFYETQLVAAGATVSWPESQPESTYQQVSPVSDTATAEEIANFVEMYGYQLEHGVEIWKDELNRISGGVMRPKYLEAFAILDMESMISRWTDEQLLHNRKANNGSWSISPRTAFNRRLNAAFHRVMDKRFPGREVTGLGMGEDGRQA